MLSISALSAGQERYYTEELARSDDYARGLESEQARGVWLGEGARRLGLEGAVRPEAFRNLFHGFSGDGNETLVQNAGKTQGYHRRKPAWDLTYSAPKSVSLIWSIADGELRQKIEAAALGAVQADIAHLERTCAFTRTGKGGSAREPARIVAAALRHGAARPAKGEPFPAPQLHHHALVLNIGVRADGRTSSLVSRPFYKAKMENGQVYRDVLAREMEGLGFTIRWQETPRGRLFEIEGVPESLLRESSPRRQEITALMAAHGREGAAEAARATLLTRQKKSALSVKELQAHWEQTARAHGFTRQSIAALRQARQIAPEPVRAYTFRALAREIHSGSWLDQRDRGQKITDALAAAPRGAAQEEKATRSQEAPVEAAPEPRQRQSRAARHEPGGSLWKKAREKVSSLYREFASWARGRLGEGEQRSLRRMLGDARTLARRHRGRSTWASTAAGRAWRALWGGRLDAAQKAALEHITRNHESLQILCARRGTDLTAVLKAARAAWWIQGYRVLGAALSGAAAKELERRTGIKSASLTSLFRSLEPHRLRVSTFHGKRFSSLWAMAKYAEKAVRPWRRLDRKTILIVDRAQALDAPRMARLLAHVRRGGGKVILVGDAEMPGAPFRALRERLGGAELAQPARPQAARERAPLEERRAATGAEALAAYARQGRLNVAPTREEAMEALLADWVREVQAGRGRRGGQKPLKDTLIVAPAAPEAADLNRRAQTDRLLSGALGRTRLRLGEGYLYTGDRVLFTRGSRRWWVAEGERGTVTWIEPFTRNVRVRLDDGRSVTLPLLRYNDLALGYAVTHSRAATLTARQAFVLLGGPGREPHADPLQATCAAAETRFYTDRESAGESLSRLSQAMGQSRMKGPAQEEVRRPPGQEERTPGR